MDQKKLATVILIIGIVGTIFFATADLTGLGTHASFGPQQMIGTIIGAILIVVGVVLFIIKPKGSN